MQIKNIKEYFDSYSKSRDWTRLYIQPPTSLNCSFLIRKQRILELVDKRGGKILDLGCGPGVMISELMNKNYEFFGIDISDEMIEEAKRKFVNSALSHRIHLAVGDVTNINYPDNHFDGVIGAGLLEYFTEFDKLFEEINRVIKPGGFLIITVPLKFQLDRFMVFLLTPIRVILAFLYHRLKNIQSRTIKRYYFLPSQLDALIDKFGFNKVDFAYYNFTLLPYPLTVLFPRITYILNSKLEKFYKTEYLSFFSTGYIAKYTKMS